MEVNKKTVVIGVFVMLLVGIVLVSASGYYSMGDLHKQMMASDDFEEMHAAMIAGDYGAAEEYHEKLDFECPMHELVKEGSVSLDDFGVMHKWMMSGDFPQEKPAELSDEAWELHVSHHPEIYS